MDNILITNFAASMFALLNPLSVLPIFISYTAGEKRKVQRWVALFLSLTVLVLLLVFFFAGSALLKFFGISLDAFRIAGGILLLIIGINIAIGDAKKSASDFADSKEASPLQEAELVYRKIVIPLAMPLLVGPGVIANVVLYATEVEYHKNSGLFFELVGTIICLSALIFAILLSGRWLQKMVGGVGLNILTRILGLLVSSMGVQFMIKGLSNIIVHSLMPEILKVH
ncbi:MAG: MarC family protein [Microcystaceae cyanobacterium]